ncbi:hypothetical protein GCM10027258_24360 [Amycolatopsis stemonae]
MIALNTELVHRIQHSGAELAASLYAAPPGDRPALADLLTEQKIRVHADLFADPDAGVDPGLIARLADRGALLDVHLLTAGAVPALDAACLPGVARVTFPFEDVADPAGVATRIRAAGASPWLAISPGTGLAACTAAMSQVDGLLVMLLEPGTRGEADPAQLEKVRRASATLPVGVDGGVGEDNLDAVLAAGATYVVIGRRLLATPPPTKEERR